LDYTYILYGRFTDITTSSFIGGVALENGESVIGGSKAASSTLYHILPDCVFHTISFNIL
jgi:hypothetical protein